MNRRDFIKATLVASIAPAIVRAENIMRINPDVGILRPGGVWVPWEEYKNEHPDGFAEFGRVDNFRLVQSTQDGVREYHPGEEFKSEGLLDVKWWEIPHYSKGPSEGI